MQGHHLLHRVTTRLGGISSTSFASSSLKKKMISAGAMIFLAALWITNRPIDTVITVVMMAIVTMMALIAAPSHPICPKDIITSPEEESANPNNTPTKKHKNYTYNINFFFLTLYESIIAQTALQTIKTPLCAIRSARYSLHHLVLPLMMLGVGSTPKLVSASTSSCALQPEYKNLFTSALNSLDARFTSLVTDLDDIGLPPLTNTLLITNILDLKEQVFDELFGTKEEREEWIGIEDDTIDDTVLDIKDRLDSNFANMKSVLGHAGQLTVDCVFDEDVKRFKMDVTLVGSIPLDLASKLSSLAVPQVIFLPSSLPSLDMNPLPTVAANYELTLPLTLDLKSKQFKLGEIKAELDVEFSADVQKDLPLVANRASIGFSGLFDIEANFAYSSLSTSANNGWTLNGQFGASMEATLAIIDSNSGLFEGAGGTLGVRAFDDNIFDGNPRKYTRSLYSGLLPLLSKLSQPYNMLYTYYLLLSHKTASVKFNFDLCDYRDSLVKSIKSFSIKNTLNDVLDEYLIFDDDSIFPSSFTNTIKQQIVANADVENKVEEIKTKISNEINAFPCSGRRRLGIMEIDTQDGSQRILQGSSSFEDLALNIVGFEGVESATAGLFPDRQEIAIDVGVHIERSLGITDFETALTSVFDDLGPAQAMFEVNGLVAEVGQIMAKATVNVAFDFVLSTGFKVNDLVEFFTSSTSDGSIGNLFFRIESLGVVATAVAKDFSIANLFPAPANIAISEGSLLISAGVQLPEPFEAVLTLSGDMENGINLSTQIKGRLAFEPFGELRAILPITATINNQEQSLTILFTDDNLFDDEDVLVKVDFDVCPVVGILQTLLDRLGLMSIAPDGILEPSSFSGIDFFNDEITTLDSFFPDTAQFFNGVLECKRAYPYCLDANMFLPCLDW